MIHTKTLLAALALASTATAYAAPLGPLNWCIKGDGTVCTAAELADPVRYKQVLVLPGGYTGPEEGVFRSDFEKVVAGMGSAGTTYAAQYANRIVYVGRWIAGGALNSPESTFGSKVFAHPIRGKATTLRQDQVIAQIDRFSIGTRSEMPWLRPWAAIVVLNTEEDVTINAAPPSVLGKPYGIAKITREPDRWKYAAAHELGHAGLNFLDEYVEEGLEEMSIGTLDYVTPLAQLDGTWGGWVRMIGNFLGVYSYKISEILAANGGDNTDTTRYPSRVTTSGYTPNEYEYEHGMFFGRGVFHDRGKNLMNTDRLRRGDDDGFAYAHSSSQDALVRATFESPNRAPRPNDRLRNAGPAGTWAIEMGGSTHVMLYDGDKQHHLHKTLAYDVQVGWWERKWKACYWGPFPYPCHEDIWRVANKRVAPAKRSLQLKGTGLYGLASAAQSIACAVGYKEINLGSGKFSLCELKLDEMSEAFLPSLEFTLPYQDVEVPTSQWFTKYYWRFRTHNGTWTSGYTGWASFNRSF